MQKLSPNPNYFQLCPNPTHPLSYSLTNYLSTKNREDWKYNKEFAKIVEKMQRGKQLKKKEFTKIHWFIWEKGL